MAINAYLCSGKAAKFFGCRHEGPGYGLVEIAGSLLSFEGVENFNWS